ncbi:hypothetical protein FLACHUCJ7_02237 [Flavobacterium chungangense]|uniref:Uncharacterized protein n=1 Tax=Flavobacterium chungangense TaxID=554283 RepID=A0A6V6Z0C8_9FLAO|nr:hypothetical protein FLACHUCJ7_02237 [Flavobacterium chungangense]
MEKIIQENRLDSLSKSSSKLVLTSSILFGLYSFYLLIEILDFLALLHSKEPDYSATYNIVHVAYFIVEMVVCLGLGLWIGMLYLCKRKNPIALTSIFTSVTIFRIVIVYYLYHYSDTVYHSVPYIYKLANPLSNFFRFSFIYIQILLTAITAITNLRAISVHRKTQHTSK